MKCKVQCENNKNATLTEVPWNDCTTWKPGEWFPLPVGFFGSEQKEYIIEGYDIFEADVDSTIKGDMKSVDLEIPTTTFSVALAICEAHNGRKMLK